MMRSGNGEAGFTLIEVLLAIAIAGTMFTAIFLGLDQAIRSREALSNPATPYVVGPAILDVIARDLSNAYFYDLAENNAFYATNSEISGRSADALSLITASQTYMPEEFAENDDLRHSYLNEVAYVMRSGAPGTQFLEIWRREDYFVDDRPHSEGDYVLLYDKVHSLELWFVSRNPDNPEGVAGSTRKEPEQMLQEGWNAVEEKGLPRAVQIVLNIWARDSEVAVDEAVRGRQARIYSFKRYVTLPQVHMSLASEQQIANWDGSINQNTTSVTASNRGGAAAATGGAGGRRGPGNRGQTNGDRRDRRQFSNRPGDINPFLQALRSRGGSPSRSGGGFGSLIGGR